MSYRMLLLVVMSPELVEEIHALAQRVRDVIREHEERLVQAALEMATGEVTPVAMMQFEATLARELREVGRCVVELVGNALEPETPGALPPSLTIAGDNHVPAPRKTPRRHVLTFFGEITLYRFGWRTPDHQNPSVFPLEEALGLVRGCTPALAERAAWLAGQAGATQRLIIERLKRDHNVSIGTGRLRALWDELSGRLEPLRRQHQARRIAELLETARQSSGRKHPVLAAGRDGVTVGEQPHGFFRSGHLRDRHRLRPPGPPPGKCLPRIRASARPGHDDRRIETSTKRHTVRVGRTAAAIVLCDGRGLA